MPCTSVSEIAVPGTVAETDVPFAKGVPSVAVNVTRTAVGAEATPGGARLGTVTRSNPLPKTEKGVAWYVTTGTGFTEVTMIGRTCVLIVELV
jgi:hypothetical protein